MTEVSSRSDPPTLCGTAVPNLPPSIRPFEACRLNHGPRPLPGLPCYPRPRNVFLPLLLGLLKHDPFITTPNAPGVVLAVFCTMTTYGLADERVSAMSSL